MIIADIVQAIVKPEDYDLICDIDNRFPKRHIKDKFNLFAGTKPKERLQLAFDELDKTVREYCFQLNVPEYLWQSVFNHETRMVQVLDFMGGSDSSKKQAMMHDVCESLTSDFTPRDNITKQEKNRLEEVAANIVFAKFPEERKYWDEYEQRVTFAALETKDADLLELFTSVVHIEKLHPELHKDLDEVWFGPTPSFYTDNGKKLYAELQKDRRLIVKGKEPISKLYKFMV